MALSETVDGLAETPSPAYVSDFLTTSDGLALTKAFMRIKDAKVAPPDRRSGRAACRARTTEPDRRLPSRF